MDEVKILTVIPVLDESKHLDRCLTSLRNQTFDSKLHRILILEGGSSDNSREINIASLEIGRFISLWKTWGKRYLSKFS